jgi:hypothetical protein
MVLQGLKTPVARLTDIHSLRLPPEVTAELQTIIYDRRMDWEPWIESADSYEELRQKIASRGYSQLPLKGNPLHSESSYNNPHAADMRTVEVRKSMVRKAT